MGLDEESLLRARLLDPLRDLGVEARLAREERSVVPEQDSRAAFHLSAEGNWHSDWGNQPVLEALLLAEIYLTAAEDHFFSMREILVLQPALVFEPTALARRFGTPQASLQPFIRELKRIKKKYRDPGQKVSCKQGCHDPDESRKPPIVASQAQDNEGDKAAYADNDIVGVANVHSTIKLLV